MASICIFPPQFLLYNSGSQIRRRNTSVSNNRLYSSQTTMSATNMASTVRRSANYQPSIWSYDYIQSLTSKYIGENYEARSNFLKKEVKTAICREIRNTANPLKILNLIDDLQRLGISYHFVKETNSGLEMVYQSYYRYPEKWTKMDLNLKALGFRLLRQHGYHIPQDIFLYLMDGNGNFKADLCDDILGLLNLYEASYLSFEDESILDEARVFVRKYLEESLENDILDQNMSCLVHHALELPLQWRVPRVEAKWFVEVYERRNGMNPTLTDLAKLDFNMGQAIHQEDLKCSSRWWRSTRWEKFSFTRDRLLENFFWNIGVNYTPHFKGRDDLTKVNALITTIDDVYDVYGTLDELEQFTDAVTKWDTRVIEELPDYMKICFLGFYNSINEMAYDTLTNKAFFGLPYLQKAWEGLFNSYLIEAKWYNSGYTPTFQEYMKNSCISISTIVILTHVYLKTSSTIRVEALQSIGRAENIVGCVCLIMRLTNDLSTSPDEMERGDVPKSIQCYMNENGVTEEEARAYIKTIISDTWKKFNKECQLVDSLFERSFIESATNLARMSQLMYGDGDGHGRPNVIKSHVLSLLIDPIKGI